MGCMISSWTFFSLVDGEAIKSQYHQSSVSNPSGVCLLMGSKQLLASGGSFSVCKTAQRTWLRILSIAPEEVARLLIL